MLFRERIAVDCKNHMKDTNTVCGQNAEFWYVKAGGTCRTTGLLKYTYLTRKHKDDAED
jgi:hypothetical protein